MNQPMIAVIGSEIPSERGKTIAYEMGKLIAQEGYILICGGRGGIMEAASKGAYEHDGLTVGILPSDSKSEANPYIKIPISTGMGFARNYIIVNSADHIVAIEGRYGTLNEISFALNLGKDVVCLKCNWRLEGTVYVTSPQEALSEIKKNLVYR